MVEEMHQEARSLKSDAPPLQQIIYLFKLIHNNNKKHQQTEDPSELQ